MSIVLNLVLPYDNEEPAVKKTTAVGGATRVFMDEASNDTKDSFV
jgi:hypothetical protein